MPPHPDRDDVITYSIVSSSPPYAGYGEKRRGRGKPAITVSLMALPYSAQRLHHKRVAGVVGVLSRGVRGAAQRYTSFECVMDSGATVSAMRTDQVYKCVDSTLALRLDQLDVMKIRKVDGTYLQGHRVWMHMKFGRMRAPIVVPFLVSEALALPVVISWRQVSSVYDVILSEKATLLASRR